MAKKFRADQLVFEQGLASSVELASRLIMAKQVIIAKEPVVFVLKPGQGFTLETVFELVNTNKFVSRGGEKLLTALEYFNFDPSNLVCLDAGASTGGFTDCLLQHNASKVYAVDVGKSQLHEKLKADARVISLEGVNLRHASLELIPQPIDLIVADVSFISLTQVLPTCVNWLKPNGHIITLIKPQFELDASYNEKGVVRDLAAQELAIKKVIDFCTERLKLTCQGTVASRLKGPKGNQEYLTLLQKII